MGSGSDDMFNPDELLKKILSSESRNQELSLRDLFELKLSEAGITWTNALDIIGIQHRTLNGILDSTQKSVDYTYIIKLAAFLQVSTERVFKLYIEHLERNFPTETSTSVSTEEILFMKENLDIPALKKSGFIGSISDFKEIANKVTTFLGLNHIMQYDRPELDMAFSTGKIKPKNELSRAFFIRTALEYFYKINNPYEFSRNALIDYFPEIRWHSTNVELGIKNVIKELFKIGVTVFYIPSLPTLHLRGATFSVNDKPCVVLTDYKGFYPTLWFALVHELFHVLFDWDEIRNKQYHLSDESSEQLSIKEREEEADSFAREYLFSKEKTELAKPFLRSPKYINELAINNQVHPSFVYAFYAWDYGQLDRGAWSKAKKHNPDTAQAIDFMDNPWESPVPISEFIKPLKIKIYS